MAYTPINWAENLDVTAVKLDKMDSQIDANENDLRIIENGYPTVNGQITENSSRITQIETFTAGENYIYQDNTTVIGSNWEEVKGATVYKNGTIRVYFQFRDAGSSTAAYARIKKNGNVIQSYTRESESFGTITRDLSISIGDKITLEVDNGFTETELRNFRLGINRESDLIVTS